jgi:hypothetical protein
MTAQPRESTQLIDASPADEEKPTHRKHWNHGCHHHDFAESSADAHSAWVFKRRLQKAGKIEDEGKAEVEIEIEGQEKKSRTQKWKGQPKRNFHQHCLCRRHYCPRKLRQGIFRRH